MRIRNINQEDFNPQIDMERAHLKDEHVSTTSIKTSNTEKDYTTCFVTCEIVANFTI